MPVKNCESQHKCSRRKFTRIARRIFSNACTFRRFIHDRNNQIADPEKRISLAPADLNGPYARLLDRLYVAWPQEVQFATSTASQQVSAKFISIDQIIQNVINGTLRKYPNRYEAQRHNILCNGFSMGSQHGMGSVFHNLDLRSPSSQIQILRSPAWKELLQNIGPALFTHLLSNSVLLVATTESSTRDFAVPSQHNPCSVFLQICGPPPSECTPAPSRLSLKGSSEIVLRRDVMYRNPNQIKRASDCILPFNSSSTVRMGHNSGLPRMHCLQGLRPDCTSIRALIATIFKGCSTSNRSSTQNVAGTTTALMERKRGVKWLRKRVKVHPRLYRVIPVLEEVIKRTHKRSFRRLLGKMCPLPHYLRRETTNSQQNGVLLAGATDPREVTKFLIACFRQLAPTSLFGSERNRHLCEKGMRTLVTQTLKRESFCIRKSVTRKGFVLRDVVWLHRPGRHGKRICNPTDHAFRLARTQELFQWLFRDVLIPILYQNFYVTEGDLHRNRVFFFRREVWIKLTDAAFNRILRDEKKFLVLSKDALAACAVRRYANLQKLDPVICPYPVLIHHELRFVPKRFSVRGIQCVRGKMLRGFSCFKGNHENGVGHRDYRFRACSAARKAKTNMKGAFRCILRILSSASSMNSRLGASVFSLDDVFDRLLHLKQKWIQRNRPAMYACIVDITTSFDTVPLGTLFSEIVPAVLTKERYVAIRYQIAKASIATGKTRQRCMVHVCAEPGEEASFWNVVRRKLGPEHAGAVFTDLVQKTTFSRDQILLFLCEFLKNSLIAVPRRSRSSSETGFAVQSQGLPQGNQLSPLLTSLFYAHIEKRDFAEFLHGQGHQHQCMAPELEKSFCLLMRQIDDTMFLTSSKSHALQFMDRMMKGWKHSHGFGVNFEKTKTNFKSGVAGKRMNHMTWCGLNIDVRALEVSNDYTRYGQSEGGCVRDALFVEKDSMPGKCFAERAWGCFKPKLHPVLLDSRLNSRQKVATNIYQAALLACLKLGSYASAIYPGANYLRFVVDVMMSKFVELVSRTMCSRMATSRRCRLPLSTAEVRYLTTHAYHKGIVKRLQRKRRMRKRTKACLQLVQERLEECAGQLQKQSNTTIIPEAKRISEMSCAPLWRLRL